MQFITQLWPVIVDHAYIVLFLGMIIGGETFLLPAVYLASRGTLSFPLVITFAVLATLVSDTFWYALGRFTPLQKLLKWKKVGLSVKIISIFKEHSQKLLFISKFVYGTRTLAQVLSGAIRMPFLIYSAVNLMGILAYFFSIVIVAILTRASLASLEDLSYNNYVSVILFILIVGIIHLCLKKWLGREFTASSSQPGTNNLQ